MALQISASGFVGRSRAPANRRLGEFVQRRAGGALELRFPIPVDVREAFPDIQGRPRSTFIRSLGTSDVSLANAKADVLRAQLRENILRVRTVRESGSVEDYLKWLYDFEVADFKSTVERDADRRRRELFQTDATGPGTRGWGKADRTCYGGALTAEDPAQRLAAAGWAANHYFESRGETPDPSTPEYRLIVDECARVLVDAILAKNAIDAGLPEPTPSSAMLSDALKKAPDVASARSAEGKLKLSDYFETIYAAVEGRTGSAQKGERNIPGKRHSVRLFTEFLGDMPVCKISRPDLFSFHDMLIEYPDSRLLKGSVKKLSARDVLEKVRDGDLQLDPMSPKTVNKHLTNLAAILKFAERRAHIAKVDTSEVRAKVEAGDESGGRSFTTAELNRIFALPLFAGCAGEKVEGGLFKPGCVKIRDDRFWIPLVLLFTGARSSEIVGLRTDEVILDHDIPHIIIQPNDVRRLKNHHSKRMVPIHSRLIAMGFLEFVRAQKDALEVRLFPMAEKTTYRDGVTGLARDRSVSSSLIMRQFNRTILDHAEARVDGGSTKCFRNTFEQESASRITSDEARQRLTGRRVVSTARIYTDNIPYDPEQRSVRLAQLKADIERLSYDGVKLDHLTDDEQNAATSLSTAG